MRSLEPGIHIGRGQARHVLPQARPPSGGQESIEGDQRTESRLERFWAGVALH